MEMGAYLGQWVFILTIISLHREDTCTGSSNRGVGTYTEMGAYSEQWMFTHDNKCRKAHVQDDQTWGWALTRRWALTRDYMVPSHILVSNLNLDEVSHLETDHHIEQSTYIFVELVLSNLDLIRIHVLLLFLVHVRRFSHS